MPLIRSVSWVRSNGPTCAEVQALCLQLSPKLGTLRVPEMSTDEAEHLLTWKVQWYTASYPTPRTALRNDQVINPVPLPPVLSPRWRGLEFGLAG